MASLRAFVLCACLLAACDPHPYRIGGDYDAGGDAVGIDPCGAASPDAEAEGTCSPSRPILACDVMNARDLGGIPLAPSGRVACGGLLRGPPLSNLTQAGCERVARLGIRTVVDLRIESERLLKPDDACVQANVVLAPLPIPFSVSPADYIADFDTTDSIAQAFHVFADAAAYPVYVHCTWGRDRTGVVAALVLLALGASRDDVMREYALSAASVGAFPASLAAVLDQVELRGGIDSALQAAGVPAAELAALRALAIDGRIDADAGSP